MSAKTTDDIPTIEEVREREVHESEMRSAKANILLLESVTKMFEAAGSLGPRFADVWLAKYAFADPESIRAQACNLILKSAEETGTEEARKDAATRLLDIADNVELGNPSNEKSKVARSGDNGRATA